MAGAVGPNGPGAPWRRTAGPLLRLLGGVGASAAATYVYLVVVARAVGPAEYASFSGFWAVVVILGAGIYLPIEQETGRRGVDTSGDRSQRPLRRTSLTAAAVVTAMVAGATVLLWPVSGVFFGGDALLALALVVGCVGYAVQYPLRGLLSARRQYGRYALVLGVEAVLRVALVVGLVVAADPGVGALAAVVGVAALGAAVVGAAGAGTGSLADRGGALAVLRSGSVLILGAVALQTLLYGAVLVARLLAPGDDAVAAGQLLAAVTVTRIPVFLFQSMEALVVPRIAELAGRGAIRGLLVAVRRLLTLVGCLAALTVTGSALAGPEVVSLMFGEGYEVSRGTMTLLGLGTGMFMLAVAASDVTVSLRGHRQVAVGWLAGLAAGAVAVLLLEDFVLQVTVPLIVGSAVAAGLLARASYTRVSALLPAAPGTANCRSGDGT